MWKLSKKIDFFGINCDKMSDVVKNLEKLEGTYNAFLKAFASRFQTGYRNPVEVGLKIVAIVRQTGDIDAANDFAGWSVKLFQDGAFLDPCPDLWREKIWCPICEQASNRFHTKDYSQSIKDIIIGK